MRNHVRILSVGATVALLLMVGCAVGPDYQRPTVSAPSAWRDQELTDSTIANLPYFKVYQDPVLQDHIATALQSNLDLVAAEARIKAATAQVTFTKADLYPNVNVGADAGAFTLSKNRMPGFSPELLDGVRGSFGLSAILNWELDIFGRIRRATEAQRAYLAATEAGRRAATVTIVGAVAETYITLRQLDRLKEIIDSNIATRREYTRLAKTLFQGGKTSELDYRQAESELRRVEAQEPQVRIQIAQAENAMNVLLNRTMGTPVRRGNTLDQQSVPPEVPSGIPSQLLERRPDVVMSEQELIAANAEVGVATAQLFPRVAIAGDVGVSSINADNLFDANSFVWQAMGNLTQPVFNAGKNLARVDAADARTMEMVAAYQNTVINAFRDVNDALVAVNNSRAIVRAQIASVEATREVVRLSELRYRYGATPYLQVLDAQRSLLSAQEAETAAIADQYRALIFLYRALGGGWVVQ